MEPQPTPEATGRITVAPSGQLDLATAPQLAQALAQAQGRGGTEIVVDLSAVDFMDSSGIAVLVQAAREVADAGGHLYLQGAHGGVAQVLEITGIADYLPPPPGTPPTDR